MGNGEVEQWFSDITESIDDNTTVAYVLGNESTDLDSTVSSISLALYLGYRSKEISNNNDGAMVKFVPMIDGSSRKLTDKHINAQYINFCGVSWRDLSLHYSSDYINAWKTSVTQPGGGSQPGEGNQPGQGSQCIAAGACTKLPYVILVDHNNITDTNSIFFNSGKVICVIDHHSDSDLNIKQTTESWVNLGGDNSPIGQLLPSEWKYVVTGPIIGSCCTLVGELILSVRDCSIFESRLGETLANLLLVTILKDTECFRKDFEGIRWSQRDRLVVDQLLPKSKWGTKDLLEECMLKIKEIGFNWNTSLTLDGNLDFLIRNDLKWFHYDDKLIKYPFTSIPISLYNRSTVQDLAPDLIRITDELYTSFNNTNINHRIMAILSREDNDKGIMIKRIFTLVEELESTDQIISNMIQTLLTNNGAVIQNEIRLNNWSITIYSIPLHMSRKVLEPLIRRQLLTN